MKKWKIAISVLAIALFAAWYAFRPERLFVNDRVNEGFRATEGSSSAEIMESGTERLFALISVWNAIGSG
jgi:hypothetical protein